ncbi:MAG: tetratricopeptide repeat protein, partial [bacterium]|nr:tetratricopeptide repeat protein [bacterium]
ALIESGALGPQEESASLVDLRDSLVEELADGLERDGPQRAAATFRQHRSSDPDAYYVDEDDLRELWQELDGEDDHEAALTVATLWVEEFPSSYVAHRDLGKSLAAGGDAGRALASFETARRLNRASYPWEKQELEEIDSLLAGRKVLATVLRAAIRRQTLDQVPVEYRRDPGRFYVNEDAINRLGYELLGSGRVAESIAVFKLNVEAFPDSFNVYDSLGEAYMADGDRELAIKNYQRSIELNPENTSGIRSLERLRSEGEVD